MRNILEQLYNGEIIPMERYKHMFKIWKKQKIAHYSALSVTKRIYEDIDNATRLKLRNEHLEPQFRKNQNDSE